MGYVGRGDGWVNKVGRGGLDGHRWVMWVGGDGWMCG